MKTAYPVKNEEIVVRKEKNEALLFNPSDGNLLCINGTGMHVWDICDGSRAAGEIAREMEERYEVPLDKAEKDCLEYLKELEKAGFIKYKDPGD